MTVETEVSSIRYTGIIDGVALAAPFPVQAADELSVFYGDNVEAVEGVDYTVALNAPDYLTADVTPLTGFAVTSGGTISINRIVPYLQAVDVPVHAKIASSRLEQICDRLTFMVQQLRDQLVATLKFPFTDPSTSRGALPSSTERASKFLAFDADGNPIAAVGSTTVGTPTTAFGIAWYALASALAAWTYLAGSAALSLVLRTRIARLLGIVSPVDPVWYGAVGDGVADDTVAIQAALTAAGVNASLAGIGSATVELPTGTFKVSSTLTIPNRVKLKGQGPGNPEWNYPAATRLQWAGGASPVIKSGAHAVGANHFGGGITDLEIDGNNQTATYLIDIGDIQNSNFERLSLRGALTANIHITNSVNAGAQAPTMMNVFRDIYSSSYFGCHGIHIDGHNGGGAEGVTLSRFDNLQINHVDGDGIRIEDVGDAMVWTRLFVFGSGTGFGVRYNSTSVGQITGSHTYLFASLKTGMYVGHSDAAPGTAMVQNIDSNDVALGPPDFIQGPGLHNINIASSYMGKMGGSARVLGFYDCIRHDAMQFMSWDSVNDFLYTSQGVWRTYHDGTGTVSDAATAGGAVVLTTDAVNGDQVYVADAPLGGGVTIDRQPQASFTGTPVGTLTNNRVRVGFLADVTNPPNNGAYVEADQTVNANYQCVVCAAGVRTTVDSGLAVAVTAVTWRIECQQAGVAFWYRAPGIRFWTLAAYISTNVPDAAKKLSFIALCRATSGAARSCWFYDYRRAFTTEGA